MHFHKVFLSLIISFSFFAVSCSSNDGEVVNENEKTLRKQAEKLLTSTNWSEEIESERLTSPIEAPQGIVNKVKITPVVLNVSNVQSEKIFPDLEGFGSLNVNNMPQEVKKLVKDFAAAFCKDGSGEEYMEKSSKYELGLLYKDLVDIISPQKDDELFDSFILGMEISNNFICEVPLRLKKKQKFVDLIVYCKVCQIEEKEKWLIDGFDIVKVSDGFKNNSTKAEKGEANDGK